MMVDIGDYALGFKGIPSKLEAILITVSKVWVMLAFVHFSQGLSGSR